MAEYFKLYNENPNERFIKKIVEILRSGGVIIYPTDTVYGLGCDIYNQKAIERIARIKGLKLENANFSFICYDLSNLSEFTKAVNNQVFKVMKHNLPGAFTFILNANSNVPKLFKSKKKTVGIRIPDNNICREIVKELGNPILTTSIKSTDEILEYPTDPEIIKDDYDKLVDAVIDGGFGNNVPSTIVDCSNDTIEIVRQGLGELEV
ncbi:MAG: threonylcarbamoyl-AMP synthase [Bacteroidales bacterium]|nr:threonylcarbamoyl-AMP synthase [Bacteroidales bacterium]MBR4349473.1 threonylcarbamoyl-AMP synthase [Bacteroidales bacterium]MBR6265802.1 threonylcarbamoyl-AMP synthase [Bacteroidales bacterium]MCR4801213.1 threonylcarbamoyl-AMP synthase [Bacteroidales bacterium]